MYFLRTNVKSESIFLPRNTQERVVPEYGDGRGQRDIRVRGREQCREGRGYLHLARRRADAAKTSSGVRCIENNESQIFCVTCRTLEVSETSTISSFMITTPEMCLQSAQLEKPHASKKSETNERDEGFARSP